MVHLERSSVQLYTFLIRNVALATVVIVSLAYLLFEIIPVLASPPDLATLPEMVARPGASSHPVVSFFGVRDFAAHIGALRYGRDTIGVVGTHSFAGELGLCGFSFGVVFPLCGDSLTTVSWFDIKLTHQFHECANIDLPTIADLTIAQPFINVQTM